MKLKFLKLFAHNVAFALCSLCLFTASANAQERTLTYMLPAPTTLPAFAPWMVAQGMGYYAQEGLHVNFISGQGGVDVAKQVGAGNVPMGGAIGDTPIIVRPNGIPVKDVAILGHGSLTLIAVRADSGIKIPAQLKGKTVTVMSYVDTTYYSLLGWLKKAGLTKNDVSIQAAGPVGVWQALVSKRAEAMAAVPEWVVFAQAAGAKVNILPPAEGFQSMAQSIIASDKVIKDDPKLVQSFVTATLRGMKLIMSDPEEAINAYVKVVPSYADKKATLAKIFALYTKYVYVSPEHAGEIDVKRLDSIQKFYVKEGIVSRAVPLDELYTNQFVKP